MLAASSVLSRHSESRKGKARTGYDAVAVRVGTGDIPMQYLMKVIGRAVTLAAVGAAVWTGPARAGGLEPAMPRDWSISYNFALTTDYVFRGVSQSAENPAVQAGVDVTYKIFYIGAWGSTIDFGGSETVEVDYYAGIKPVWGPLTFDFGVIYYSYPGAAGGGDLDFVELKAGVSGSFWRDGTLGFTAFWTPEGTLNTGEIWTLEGTIAQVLPKFRDITPTISGTLGYQIGDNAAYIATFNDDDYLYWNAGISLGFHERFAIDLRYWDTNLSGVCNGPTFQCDERFVATAKVTY